jgi:hypothetical protein
LQEPAIRRQRPFGTTANLAGTRRLSSDAGNFDTSTQIVRPLRILGAGRGGAPHSSRGEQLT